MLVSLLNNTSSSFMNIVDQVIVFYNDLIGINDIATVHVLTVFIRLSALGAY